MSSTYITMQGDMWDLISYRVYGTEKHVKTLLEANPMYRDVAVFPAGVELVCPEISAESATVLPPWRR
ncbi:tail protein X [uncultured Megasphaera sp.]|uniref:tail protein X n=1 Tax=uncultured Megasphaera sp. TaxID=165188 RepID=UPI0025EC79AC|nr:tail protein X [uncultured Megasphaera sp.]